jgi:hypothetical protein
MIEFYIDQTDTGLDANSTSTVTTSVDIKTCYELIFYVFGITGTHTTHVFELQVSPNDTDWQTHSSSSVTGEGHIHITSIDSHAYARVKCTTV